MLSQQMLYIKVIKGKALGEEMFSRRFLQVTDFL